MAAPVLPVLPDDDNDNDGAKFSRDDDDFGGGGGGFGDCSYPLHLPRVAAGAQSFEAM